jgi:hypothetical protein
MRMWRTTGGTDDPQVIVGGDAYRVTPTGAPDEFLVTRRRDGVRLGFVQLVSETPWRVGIRTTPEDLGASELLERIGWATQRALVNGWE